MPSVTVLCKSLDPALIFLNVAFKESWFEIVFKKCSSAVMCKLSEDPSESLDIGCLFTHFQSRLCASLFSEESLH